MAVTPFREQFTEAMNRSAAALPEARLRAMLRDTDQESVAYGISIMNQEQRTNLARGVGLEAMLRVVDGLHASDAAAVASSLPKDTADEVLRRADGAVLRKVFSGFSPQQMILHLTTAARNLAKVTPSDPLGNVGAGIDVAHMLGDPSMIDALRTSLADQVAVPLRKALGDKYPTFVSAVGALPSVAARSALGGLNPTELLNASTMASSSSTSLGLPSQLTGMLGSDPASAAMGILSQVGAGMPTEVSSLLATMFSDADVSQVLGGTALASLQSRLGGLGAGLGTALNGNLGALVGSAGGGALGSLLSGAGGGSLGGLLSGGGLGGMLSGGGLGDALAGGLGGLNPQALANPLAALGGGALGTALGGLGTSGVSALLSGNPEFVTAALDGMADGVFKKLDDALKMVAGVPDVGGLLQIQDACASMGKTLESKVTADAQALKRQVLQMAGVTDRLGQIEKAISQVSGAVEQSLGKLREETVKHMPSMADMASKMTADLSLVKAKEAMGSLSSVLGGLPDPSALIAQVSGMADGALKSFDNLGQSLNDSMVKMQQ